MPPFSIFKPVEFLHDCVPIQPTKFPHFKVVHFISQPQSIDEVFQTHKNRIGFYPHGIKIKVELLDIATYKSNVVRKIG